MKILPWIRRRGFSLVLGGIALPCVVSLTDLPVLAQEPGSAPVAAPAASPLIAADLAQLRALALEHQPAIKAQQASVLATMRSKEAIERLILPGLVRRDLQYRREQAGQGLLASQAHLNKVEWETRYNVTRNYLSALFAQEQYKIASKVLGPKDQVTSLYYLEEVATKAREGRRDVKSWDVGEIKVLIQTAQARREEASAGKQRALAALREAVGLEPCIPIQLNEEATLPDLAVSVPCKEEVVRLALQRRGEMIQATVAVALTCLEVKAQSVLTGFKADTFASAADLHAIPVPQGSNGAEYRPAAVAIEMPTQLIGNKDARVQRARAFHARAEAVADKTRQLIALEAEDAYLKWQEAARQEAFYRQALKEDEILNANFPNFDPADPMSGRPRLDEVLKVRNRTTELKLRLNQARYDLLLALATLERVTAGGVNPGFDPAIPGDAH